MRGNRGDSNFFVVLTTFGPRAEHILLESSKHGWVSARILETFLPVSYTIFSALVGRIL